MFDNPNLDNANATSPDGNFTMIEPGAGKVAYDTIPDSVWRDYADQVFVVIAISPPRIVAGSNDLLEIKTLAVTAGVPCFICPSKFYQRPLFEKQGADSIEEGWDDIPLPSVDVATRRGACNSIPDSVWRNYADQALVAIALEPARIIAASSDNEEVKLLADRKDVPYFVTSSKFYQDPQIAKDRNVQFFEEAIEVTGWDDDQIGERFPGMAQLYALIDDAGRLFVHAATSNFGRETFHAIINDNHDVKKDIGRNTVFLDGPLAVAQLLSALPEIIRKDCKS